MPFSLKCVQYMVTSILQDQQYMFGVKSFLTVEKVLLMRNLFSALCSFDDDQCNDTIAAVDSLMRSNRRVMG